MTREEIIQAIKEMSVLDLNELVKACEEEFGVSASAPVAAAGVAGAAVEEKTEFDVILASVGPNKIKVIKVVRELTGLGLKEAKEIVGGGVCAHGRGVSAAGGDDEEPCSGDHAGARAGPRLRLHPRRKRKLDAGEAAHSGQPDGGDRDRQPTDDRFFIGLTGFLEPPSLWLGDAQDGSFSQAKAQKPLFDASQDVVEQLEATSKDGTKVPYFVVHREGHEA